MFPKEHGAYGQLLFPIVTAMAIGRPTLGALCLAVAVTCAFLGHEPLMVVAGLRGVRAQREERHRARHWVLAFAIFTSVSGVAAIGLMPHPARLATLAVVPLGAVVILIAVFGRGRTVVGETLTAIALASVAFPVAIACGASTPTAATVATVFAAGFSSATLAVRSVIARTRTPPATAARASAAVFAVAANVAAVWLGHVHVVDQAAGWTAHPLALLSIALAVIAPSAKNLRTVGWTLVATTTLTAVMLAAALR